MRPISDEAVKTLIQDCAHLDLEYRSDREEMKRKVDKLPVMNAVPREFIEQYRDYWMQEDDSWHVINGLLLQWDEEKEV